MSSYRFLVRGGIAVLVLAIVAVVGAHTTTLRPVHHPLVAHITPWNHWKQVEVARPAAGHGAPLRILVIGASVSHGLGASAPGHDYVSDLRTMIEHRTDRPVDITVWSRPGATIKASTHWGFPGQQQIVITQLITNDFIEGTPLLSYEQSVSTLLARIRATSPSASLLCVGAWEPGYAVDRVGIPVLAYDTLDQRACAGNRGHYLSPSPIFQDGAFRGPIGRHTAFGRGDDFHPNNQGHYHLACAILHQLEADHALPPGTRHGAVLGAPGSTTDPYARPWTATAGS